MTAPDPPAQPTYVAIDQLDPCELPPLLIVVDGKVKVATGTWTCIHNTTWTAVPVAARGGLPQMLWIIRPPDPTPTPSS